MFTKKEYLEKGNLIAEVSIEENVNIRTGDIDQTIEANFFNKKAKEVGWCRVFKRGQHIKPIGDINLANYFGLTSEA